MLGRLSSFFQQNSSQESAFSSAGDYLSAYLSPLSPENQIRVAKRILGKIPLGQKQLIEPIVGDDGILKYMSKYSDPQKSGARQIFDSVDEAIEYFSSLSITDVYSISKDNVPTVYKGYAQVLRQIESSAVQKKLFGIEALDMNIVIHRGDVSTDAGREALARFFQVQSEKGYGMLLPNDEGGFAMNFVATIGGQQRVLTVKETLEVMQSAGVSVIDPDVLDEALKSGNKKLSSLIQKLDKRLRGVLSPREVSVAGDLMDRMLELAGAKGKTFADTVLATDPVFEILGLALDVDTTANLAGVKNVQKAQDAAQYIKDAWSINGLDPNNQSKVFYNTILEEVIKGQSGPLQKYAGREQDLFQSINAHLTTAMRQAVDSGDIDVTSGRFGIDELKKQLKGMNISEDEMGIIDTLLDEVEKGSDGSQVLNKKYSEGIRASIKEEIDSINVQIEGATNRLEKEELLLKRMEKQRSMDQLSSSKGLSQITVRGNLVLDEGDSAKGVLARIFSLKGAAQVVDFQDKYSAYSVIAPKSTLKRETRISGITEILNISGTGESKGAVYADPMLDAFHSAVFGSKQANDLALKYSADLQSEMRAMLVQNRIDENSSFYQSLVRAANLTDGDILETQQFSQMMHRTLAQELLAMHRSGIPLDQQPRALNRMLDFAQTEFFKIKKGIPLPAMPDVYRFALNAESIETARGGRKFLGMEDSLVKMDEGFNISTTRVRFSNHNLLMSERDVIRFHHALGGFDLDDKGLPVLGTYMSGGKRSLAMAMARQPTGAGEMIGFVQFKDIESYQELFGHNKFFMKALDEMIEEEQLRLDYMQGSGGSPTLQKLSILKTSLQEKLSQERMTEIDNSQLIDDLEQTIISVRDRLYDGKARTFDRSYFESLGVLKKGTNQVDFFAGTKLVDYAGVDPGLAQLGFQKLKTEVVTKNLESNIFSAFQELMTDQQKSQLSTIVDDIEALKAQTYAGATIPADIYSDPEAILKLENAQAQLSDKSKLFYQTLDSFNLDKEKMATAFNAFYLDVQAKAAMEEGGNLGKHVNRATAIADGINQFEKAFADDAQILQKLKDRELLIGFPSSETAVDMTQTFTSGRLQLKMEAEAAADQVYGMEIFRRMYGNNFDLEEHGLKSVSQYGEMFGYLQGRGGNQFIIDKALIDFGKLNKEDLNAFAQAYITGAMNRIEEGLDYDKEAIFRLENLFSGNDDPAKKTIIKTLTDIGVIAEGNLSRTVQAGRAGATFIEAQRKRVSDNFNVLRNTLTRDMGENFIEAQEAAKAILDRNEDILKEYLDLNESVREAKQKIQKGLLEDGDNLQEIEQALESNTVKREILRTELGDNFLREMNEVRSNFALTGFNIINALELESIDRGLSPYLFEGLQDISQGADEDFLNLLFRINVAKRTKSNYQTSVMDARVKKIVDNFFQASNSMRDVLISDIVSGKVASLDEYGDIGGIFDGFDTQQLRQAVADASQGQFDDNILTIANAIRSRAFYEQQIMDPTIDDFLNGMIASDQVAKPGSSSSGVVGDVLRNIADFSESRSVSPSKFTPLTMDYLKEQFSKPGVVRAAVGAGLLIAGSFFYQNKKDKTIEDAAGPPLLPGGSAYENDYPTANIAMPGVSPMGYSSGMNYKVSLYGSRQQVETFRQAASGLTNGAINSTMYNRIPDVSSDPYQQLASSF